MNNVNLRAMVRKYHRFLKEEGLRDFKDIEELPYITVVYSIRNGEHVVWHSIHYPSYPSIADMRSFFDELRDDPEFELDLPEHELFVFTCEVTDD